MRFSISLLALLAASPALAEDFLVRADVAEALVYASGAEVVRRTELELEPGTHRILFPSSRMDLPPIVSASAGTVGEVEALHGFRIEDGALDTEAQSAARAAVTGAEDVLEAAQEAFDAAAGAVRAAELQQAYLQSIVRGGEDGVAMPEDAAALAAILATLGGEMTRAETALHDARQIQMDRRDALAERQMELAEAQRVLAGLQPIEGVVSVWAVTLELEAAERVTLEIDDVEEASWAPVYDVHLDSDTGALTFERHIALYANGWQDVSVTLSTANPNRSRAPSPTPPSRASIYEAEALGRSSGGLLSTSSLDSYQELAPAPVAEPALIVEDRGVGPLVEGLSVSYPYPEPITIGPDSAVFLPFGEIALQAELINRAVPRRDGSAFLVADFENNSDDPILPGEARFFRDGAAIGDGFLDFIPQGAERELPFGPLDHIQLEWADLSRDTGDRGVFLSSNTEDRQVMVSAENLSGEAVEIELLYATPFSEQEDLEIDIGVSVLPDENAWEDLRGVYAWSLTLEPQSEAQINLSFRFNWPDGQVLDWRP